MRGDCFNLKQSPRCFYKQFSGQYKKPYKNIETNIKNIFFVQAGSKA